MRLKLIHAFALLLTATCGVGVVTLETPVNLLMFLLWCGVAIGVTRRQLRKSPEWPNIAVAGGHALLMGTIIAVAALLPGKRIDVLLERTISLDRTELTLAELSEYCRWNRELLPVAIYLPTEGTVADTRVRFPAREISVRQFIAEIETQTGTKHFIGGCGNAYTILHGNAYNFGLAFYAPANSEGE